MPGLTLTALEKKKPATDEMIVAASVEDRNRLKVARDRLDAARFINNGEQIQLATENLEKVKAEVRKGGISLPLVALGRKRWDALVLEHRPTPVMVEEDKDKPDTERRTYNPETFWPALLIASIPGTKLTIAQVNAQVFDNDAWNDDELVELQDRMLSVNKDSLVVDLGN